MEDVIKEAYESNSGSAYETYKDAVKKGSSIRPQDVKKYLSKRDHIQVKSKPKGSNSFVPPGAKFEFEIDILDMESKDATSNARYGLVAIDNFSKIAEVARIKNRTPESMIGGLKKNIYLNGETKTAILR